MFAFGRVRGCAVLVRQAVDGSDDLPIAVCDAGFVSVARQNPAVGEGVVAGSLETGSYSGGVRFEVLGRLRVIERRRPVAAMRAFGVRLGGARQQLVLAMLLAEPNSVVSTDALVDGLWGDSPPSAARHTVQGYVSELRKVLGPVIEREAGGLRGPRRRLVARLVRVRVTRQPGAGRARRRSGGCGGDCCGLRWDCGGDAPFTGLDDASVLLAERTRLVAAPVVGARGLCRCRVGVGSPPRGGRRARSADVASTRFARGCGPSTCWRCTGRAGRPRRCGRSSGRERCWSRSSGIEPSPLLRQLEEQILVQDPALDLAPAAGEAIVGSRAGRRATRTRVCERSPRPMPTPSTAATS